MTELEPYEYEQFDVKWDNKHCIPCYNPYINKFFDKSVRVSNIIKNSYNDTLRGVRLNEGLSH